MLGRALRTLLALELAAAHPKVILENFYKKSANGVKAGSECGPT